MSGLVPFNKKRRSLMSRDFDDFGDFYNMVDDLFNFNWPSKNNIASFRVDVHKERRYSSMSRSIYLSDAKSEGIKANLENGVLKITVPKESKPNNSVKIDIE